MYFPYLRGRKNELLAVRELLDRSLLSPKVVPIIEPVKFSPTLTNTLITFDKNKRNLVFIGNPKVGSFQTELNKSEGGKIEALEHVINSTNIIPGLIVDSQSSEDIKFLEKKGIYSKSIIAICTKRDSVQFYEDAFVKGSLYNVIPYEPSFRKIRGNRILIDDKFTKQDRNTDYAIEDDEFFSDDHIYCYDDGYKGFSDYSIVGDDYKVSGFAPYAVAIHIVYIAADKSLRIKHFVSNSNEDISDPANKFYEAVTKLVKWNKTMKLDTFGINTFEDIYRKGSYPGLGVVKKLCIMHHIELIGKYLDGVNE